MKRQLKELNENIMDGILKDRLDNVPNKEIMEKYNISSGTLYNIIKKAGNVYSKVSRY